MRIITGTLKGRKIHVPNNLDVRPTSDRTKEGLFSTIDARKYIHRSQVLDLFAGSGNLGFEALSRGARQVLFVDSSSRNIRHIEKLADRFELSDRIRTVISDVEDFINGTGTPYDFIFADPPYNYRPIEEMVETILTGGWLKKEGWLAVEHNKHHDFNDYEKCIIVKSYGRTYVSIFTPNPGIYIT